MDFIVLGLPRSGTTWLANFLTTDRSLCLHDPFADALPEHWPRDGRRFGIACTGAYLMPTWLAQHECPVAVIERDPDDCNRSLRAMGLPPDAHRLRRRLDGTEGRRFRFADLWNEERAHDLWAFLLPGVPFDALRYRLLRQMQVQPKGWPADPHVARELVARGLLKQEN